jgi:hypothetical protein
MAWTNLTRASVLDSVRREASHDVVLVPRHLALQRHGHSGMRHVNGRHLDVNDC